MQYMINNPNFSVFRDIKKSYVFLYLAVFSICLEFTFDDKARNILLVAFMLLSLTTFTNYRKFYKADILIVLFIICILLFSNLAHTGATRWSTVIYSCLFCLSFMVFLRAYDVSKYSRQDFILTIKILIYAYFFVLVIQQLSVLIGIPPFNLRGGYDAAEPFKLNSLGAEVSWSGRIIALLFYAYITVRESDLKRKYSFKLDLRQDSFIWFAFCWSMITMISATAILFLLIVLSKFIKFKNILLFIPFVCMLLFVAEIINFEPYERVRDVSIAVITLDERSIIVADHSASYRIVPLIVTAKSIEIFSFAGMFGNGVDSVSRNLNFGLGSNSSSVSLLGVWYEYGFIAFLIFMVLSLRLCVDTKKPVSIIFWFLLVFLYNLNVQIPWLAFMLLYLVKNYTRSDRFT
jgi:hypothetical protein